MKLINKRLAVLLLAVVLGFGNPFLLTGASWAQEAAVDAPGQDVADPAGSASEGGSTGTGTEAGTDVEVGGSVGETSSAVGGATGGGASAAGKKGPVGSVAEPAPEPAPGPATRGRAATKPAASAPTGKAPAPSLLSGGGPLSSTEEFFARALGATVPLRQFGYEMFAGRLAGGASSTEANVPDNYPLGPGDELVITVPLSTREIRETVDRSGTIFIPNFGTLPVAGQSLVAFQASLRQRARGAKITVRLGRLRTLSVYLAGRVASPGSYTVNALATISTLLQEAGGVLKTGSLRHIGLRRRGAEVLTFDFYDFLLQGKSAGNVRLEAGDIVFVPTVGPLVGVGGQVRQPAIYEIRGAADIAGVLQLAGGLVAQADAAKVQVQSIRANRAREVHDLDLRAPADAGLAVHDGDLILVSGILDRFENGVALEGNVERPGLYEIKPGTRVSDVIGAVRMLKRETYFDYAQIERAIGADRHVELLPINLGKALAHDASNDLLLEPGDTIRVFGLADFRHIPMVEIGGSVLKPGRYRLYDKLRLSTLINIAGGLLPEADRISAELSRTEIVDNVAQTKRLAFSPAEVLAHKGGASDLPLTRNDVVVIKPAIDYHVLPNVEVQGAVGQPGTYPISEGDTLASLVERVGGYLPRAYLHGAVFVRESVRRAQQEQIDTLAQRLEQSLLALGNLSDPTQRESLLQQRALLERLKRVQAVGRVVIHLDDPATMRSAGDDLRLEANDRLYIPRQFDTVSVLGAVYSPNAFKHNPSMTVADYLRISGGPTPQGDVTNLYVVRADGQVHSRTNYREGWFIFSHGLLASRLEPGDALIIPEKVIGPDPWVQAAQITQVVSQVFSSMVSGVILYNTFRK